MKVGIVGCGGVAPGHIRVYQQLGDEIVGLCDLNLQRAKTLGSEFKVEKIYSNYFDMFEANKLDLVDICTPVSTHKKIVCDSAKYSPAILVEKPMAMTVAECQEMINAVNKNGSKLCIGHNQIFSPLVQKGKSLVESGKFDLLSFSTTQKESFEILKANDLAPAWNVSPDQRGIIWEVCCHLAYLQLYFLPDIKEIYAVGSKSKYPVYDNFSVLLRTSSGRYGLIELSWLSNETEIVWELGDSSGQRVQMHRDYNYFCQNSTYPPISAGKVLINMLTDEKRLFQKWGAFASNYFYKKKLIATASLVTKYVESIKNNSSPPVTPQDGINTINLLESIEKSLDEKRSIPINLSN